MTWFCFRWLLVFFLAAVILTSPISLFAQDTEKSVQIAERLDALTKQVEALVHRQEEISKNETAILEQAKSVKIFSNRRRA